LYAGETSRQIEEEYVADGRVAMVFIDFPIPGHGYSAVLSHEAAHCATDQGAYWDMHYAVFDQKDRLLDLDPRDDTVAIPVLAAIADEIGLDAGELTACLESKIYRPIVGNLMEQSQQRGISMTPTLVIMSISPDDDVRNEVVAGYLPMDEFRPYIERALSHAQGTPVPDPEPPPGP
jgi:protein-disulfide isomerase